MKPALLRIAMTCAIFFGSVYGFHFAYRAMGLGRPTPKEESSLPAVFLTGGAMALAHARTNLRLRRSLRSQIEGQPPQDGDYVALAGTIRSNGAITTPFSGRPAAYFKYLVYRGGKNRTMFYRGEVLPPSVLVTSHGELRLLAIPTESPRAVIDEDKAYANFQTYLQSTSFESDTTERKRPSSRTWSDDNGFWRSDVKVRAIDIRDAGILEEAVFDGERACVIGGYSRARAAIVPPENWFHRTEIVGGDARAGLKYLTHWALLQQVLAALLLSVAMGIVYLYVSDQWQAWPS